MKTIVFNTIKITIASIISILVAYALKLDFAVAAGIVTILSIQPTKKETIKTAVARFLAFVCALGIAWVCFAILGVTIQAFFVYLFFFIGLCLVFKWNNAMAMNSVLISHFLTLGNMNLDSVVNEVLIFVVGVSAGIFANSHLSKDTFKIEELKDATDNQIKKILSRMSERIMTKDLSDYNGTCFEELSEILHKAQAMANLNYNNELKGDSFDREYLKMREHQCEVLFEMYKNVKMLNTSPAQAKTISEFFMQISKEYHKDNTVESLLRDFRKIDSDMKSEPLPVERVEFEDRARLFVVLRLLEEFLMIKKEFAESSYLNS